MDEGVKKAPIQAENFNMIRHFILTLSAFIILGCASGGGGGLATPDGRIDFKRVTKFDGRVLDLDVLADDGSIIKLNTARDATYTFATTPVIPDHSGRIWTLFKRTRDNTTIALAHVNSDRVEAVYRRSDLFEKRRELMVEWADYLTPTRSRSGTRAIPASPLPPSACSNRSPNPK